MNHDILDLHHMQASARIVTAELRVLANEDRTLLMCQISQGDTSVGEREAALASAIPRFRRKTCVLLAEHLVATRRDAKRIFNSIADPKVMAVLGRL